MLRTSWRPQPSPSRRDFVMLCAVVHFNITLKQAITPGHVQRRHSTLLATCLSPKRNRNLAGAHQPRLLNASSWLYLKGKTYNRSSIRFTSDFVKSQSRCINGMTKTAQSPTRPVLAVVCIVTSRCIRVGAIVSVRVCVGAGILELRATAIKQRHGFFREAYAVRQIQLEIAYTSSLLHNAVQGQQYLQHGPQRVSEPPVLASAPTRCSSTTTCSP